MLQSITMDDISTPDSKVNTLNGIISKANALEEKVKHLESVTKKKKSKKKKSEA